MKRLFDKEERGLQNFVHRHSHLARPGSDALTQGRPGRFAVKGSTPWVLTVGVLGDQVGVHLCQTREVQTQ